MCTYIPNEKFDLIRISVLRDIIKAWKKLPISKKTRLFVFHNVINNKLVKKYLFNKQSGNLSFFIANEFIDFQNPNEFF